MTPRTAGLTGLALALLLMTSGLLAGVQQATAPAAGSESNGTPEARAMFERAEALRLERKAAQAVPLYREAAALDPLFAEAHWQYIWNAQTSDKDRAAAVRRLREEYTAHAAKADSAVVQWALGKLADNYVEAEKYYLQATKLDPRFARVYQDLALIADFRGENAEQVEYLRKAAELNPGDPSYLFYYASAIRDDAPLYRRLSLEVADRFPTHERGAQALYWLAFREADRTEKARIYERLRRDYPPSKFSWSASGMTGLFDVYQTSDPEKALALAREMAAGAGQENKTWQQILEMQEAVVQARSALGRNEPAAAVAVLEKVRPYRYIEASPFLLLRAEARAAAGDRQKAYQELLEVIATEPQEVLEEAAVEQAEALGKSRAQMMEDVWRIREAKATPAPGFDLPDYYNPGKTVSLEQYRGRVVLVNFWYPACGPCRGEFPHLQRLAVKYAPRGFEILALNVHPEEDPFVVPYMKNNNFIFRPLKTTAEWAKEKYNAVGMPANFLVDHEGRIMFRPGVINGERAERIFERQLQQLLDRAEAARQGRTPGQ